MSKLEEKDILGRLKVWRSCAVVYLSELWTKKDDRVYKRIVELIKIFFAKEISSGPIKEDITRPVLIKWLEGINQAATSVNDDYVMKATTQLIDEFRSHGKIQEYLDGVKAEISALSGVVQLASLWSKDIPDKNWLPTAENINALPDPVRNYIADMQTNADPPSMVADNIILRDTIKALEIKCEEKPAVDEGFINTWVNELEESISPKPAMIHQRINREKVKYMLREAGVEC